jgi:hypothetical protein
MRSIPAGGHRQHALSSRPTICCQPGRGSLFAGHWKSAARPAELPAHNSVSAATLGVLARSSVLAGGRLRTTVAITSFAFQ